MNAQNTPPPQRLMPHQDHRASRTAAAAIAFLLMIHGVTAWGQDPAGARAETLASEIAAARGDIRALGAMIDLRDALEHTGLKDAQKAMEALGKPNKLHPSVRPMVAVEQARLKLQRADRAGAGQLLDQAGFVRHWQIIGPFANDGMSGMDTPYGPEDGVDLGKVARGRSGDVSWQPMTDRDLLGTVDAQTLIRPVEGSVVYAATTLTTARAQKASLTLAATCAYKLWHNGALIAAVDEPLGGEFDRDVYGLSLSKGENLIVLKMGNETGPMTFGLRLTDTRGAALSNAKVQTDTQRMRAGTVLGTTLPDKPTGQPAPLELYTQWAKGQTKDPQAQALALARAARLARFYRPEDPKDPARALLKSATALARTPAVMLSASATHPQQWLRREAIEAAAKATPDDPWIAFNRARIAYNSAGDAHYTDAWRSIDALVTKTPRFAAAWAMKINMMVQEGLTQSALATALKAQSAHPDHPGLLAAANNAAIAAIAPDKQAELCALQLKSDATNIGIYSPCLSVHLQRGDQKGAMALVEQAMVVRRDITGFYILKSSAHRAMGDLEAAEKALATLTALVPGDASYWQQLGVIRQERGDDPGALVALRQALKLDPRNAPLKDYLDQLAPREPTLEERWVVDLSEAMGQPDPAFAKDKDVIYLVDQKVTRVYPNGLTSYLVQKAWQVLTEPGTNRMRSFAIPYTPGEEAVEIIKARVTRPDGTTRDTYELFEQSLSEPWYNLYYDYRALVLYFADLAPGDTVEVQYRINQTSDQNILGDYFGDLWFFQDEDPRALARYVLISPQNLKIQARDPSLKHDIQTEEIEWEGQKLTARTWAIGDVPTVESEAQQPGYAEIADYLHLSTYATWDQVADWYWDLVKDQLVVDDDIRRIVAEETKGMTDRRAKVSALHNYVVKNTRYVGLEFGIHGYKPYRTTLCLQRRFGDCKDKASLIKVMLGAAGIEANIVLIRTRRNGAIDTNPPSLQIFDHAIAYVPEFDLFLDGTAEYSGTGELPFGDQGASVLIVKDGGKFTFGQTPILPAAHNSILSTWQVDMTAAEPQVDVSLTVTGDFAAGYRNSYGTVERQKEDFGQALAGSIVGAGLTHVQFSDLTQLEAPVRVSYRFEGGQVVSKEGKKLRFYPMMRPSKAAQNMAPWPTREQVLELGPPNVRQETYVVRLPKGAAPKALPENQELTSAFGRFSLTVEQRDEATGPVLEMRVTIQIDAHRVSPEDYPALRQWLGQIDRVLSTSVVYERP